MDNELNDRLITEISLLATEQVVLKELLFKMSQVVLNAVDYQDFRKMYFEKLGEAFETCFDALKNEVQNPAALLKKQYEAFEYIQSKKREV